MSLGFICIENDFKERMLAASLVCFFGLAALVFKRVHNITGTLEKAFSLATFFKEKKQTKKITLINGKLVSSNKTEKETFIFCLKAYTNTTHIKCIFVYKCSRKEAHF